MKIWLITVEPFYAKISSMGNTVGSRGVLTQRQREIIVGALLGDACLERNGRHTRMRIDHYEKHREYVFWLAEELAPFSLRPRRINEIDKRNNKAYPRWHFSTRTLSLFDEFRELFYRGGRKVIPSCLGKMISPLSLAVWYMDDGFKRKDCRGFYLCTSSYTRGEQKAIGRVLRVCFGIKTKIHYQRQYQRIYVPAKFTEYFNGLVRPFVLPVFAYKLL